MPNHILKYLISEVISTFILKIKKNKKYKIEKYRGLNLGCGVSTNIDYLGVDGGSFLLTKYLPASLFKKIFKYFNTYGKMHADEFYKSLRNTIHFDLKYGIPFSDNSIPNIYSSHFFEHLTKDDAIILLKECYRVLYNNGIIRIVVPSLEWNVVTIEKAINEYHNGNIAPINLYLTYNEDKFFNNYSHHRWMYNFKEMENVLHASGFSNIKEFSFGIGNIPYVKELDTRSGLFVEAVKLKK